MTMLFGVLHVRMDGLRHLPRQRVRIKRPPFPTGLLLPPTHDPPGGRASAAARWGGAHVDGGRHDRAARLARLLLLGRRGHGASGFALADDVDRLHLAK